MTSFSSEIGLVIDAPFLVTAAPSVHVLFLSALERVIVERGSSRREFYDEPTG